MALSRRIMQFEGLIAPPVTPTHPNGDLNVSVIGQYVDHLVTSGVEGVFVNGTTGETVSFTPEERKKSAEAWVKEGKNKLKCIIVHIGTASVRETQELARHAEAIGADGIASLPPLYFKPATVDELVAYLAEVAAAAPKTPFYYYHFPGITSVNFSNAEILEKGRAKIPTMVGAKHTSIDMFDLAKALKAFEGGAHVLNGYDELLAPAMIMGVRAAVGASYNFSGPISKKLATAFKNKDMEGLIKQQEILVQMIKTFQKHGWGVAAFKAVTDMVTSFPIGPPRSPLRPLSAETRKALAKDLEALGIPIIQKNV